MRDELAKNGPKKSNKAADNRLIATVRRNRSNRVRNGSFFIRNVASAARIKEVKNSGNLQALLPRWGRESYVR
jgi:hypothetical protein